MGWPINEERFDKLNGILILATEGQEISRKRDSIKHRW
jgi:hypothetical protein